MHLCFIVENSLTMLQKTSNSQLNIFDQIKHSLETVLKNVFRSWNFCSGKQPSDVIHFFATSSTEPISSYIDNHEMHILHQVRNLQCTIPTFPAQVIESALYHVGKFKCLNQTETCLGYRQGNVSEPAFIFYITDNSNVRQIQKINQKILDKKFHLRAEYKFITIKYCAPSLNEASLNNRDKFKSFVQSQRQSLMMEQVMQKVNGKLLYVYSSDQLINIIQNMLFKGIETVSMGLSNKEYKIYKKEIIKIQFPTPAAEQKYFQRIRSLKKQYALTKTVEKSQVDLFVDCLHIYTRPSIPLPHEITPKILTQGKIIINEFEPLKYFVDFTKEYVGSIGQGMRFLRNIFQIVQNKELLTVFQDFTQEKKFPFFYEKEKTQYLIGYLRVYLKQPQNPLSRTCQLHVSFSNFTNLNATIRSYFERNPLADQCFQNYISTLPMFYHKTLKFLLSFSNIVLSPQAENCFENIHNKPIGLTNMKLYEQRLAEKNQLVNLQKDSFQRHQQRASKCCSIYSKDFEKWQIEKSQFYSSQFSSTSKDSELTKFLKDSIQKVSSMQPSTFMYNYITPPQVNSNSMTFQVKKYSNIRRNDEEMDKLVGGIFGNPFRKINKKVKLHVEAESVWVQPQEVGMMKELLKKEMQVYSQMVSQLSSDQVAEMDNILKMDNIYDKLAGVKGIIADAVRKVQDMQKAALQKVVNKEQIFNKGVKQNQNDNTKELRADKEQWELGYRVQEGKMIEQEGRQVEMSTGQLNEEEQRLMNSWMEENAYKEGLMSEKGQDNKVLSYNENMSSQKQKILSQNQKMVEENSQSTPQIIEEVNSKFPMFKSVLLEIPTYLIRNDLFTRNKAIISEALLTYLGLTPSFK